MSKQMKTGGGDELLHRFHDGELDEAERARVEAGLGADDREKLAALDDMGSVLRAVYGGQAQTFDAWPAVEKSIGEGKVIPFAQRLRKRSMVWLSSTAAVAAAAALMLVFIPHGGHPSNDCDVDEVEVSGAVDTIMKLDDDAHGGSTTVLWIEE